MQGSDLRIRLAAPATGGEKANGAGAAAVLAAGIGSFVLGALAVLADKNAALKDRMIFSRPTGPLSGVTTAAIVAWLLMWIVLHVWWRRKEVAPRPVVSAALALLALALLLTFPPIADWL
jgi:hypothetical protein